MDEQTALFSFLHPNNPFAEAGNGLIERNRDGAAHFFRCPEYCSVLVLACVIDLWRRVRLNSGSCSFFDDHKLQFARNNLDHACNSMIFLHEVIG